MVSLMFLRVLLFQTGREAFHEDFVFLQPFFFFNQE